MLNHFVLIQGKQDHKFSNKCLFLKGNSQDRLAQDYVQQLILILEVFYLEENFLDIQLMHDKYRPENLLCRIQKCPLRPPNK